MLLRTAPILTTALLCFAFPATALPQQQTTPPPQDDSSKKQERKVWTDDDLKRLPDSVGVVGQPAAPSNSQSQNASASEGQNAANGSQKSADQESAAAGYQKQLEPLRHELEQIDQKLNAIQQAQRNGSGASDVVSLANVPAGVDTQGEKEVLQKRRAEVAADIDNLESEALRNGITPGELRGEPPAETTSQPAGGPERENTGVADQNPEIADAQKAVDEEQDHLERATKELDLLRRELNLDQQTVYSNPNYSTTGSGDSQLNALRMQIGDKQTEVDQAEQKLDQLRGQVEDLRRNPPEEKNEKKEEAASAAPTPKLEEGKGETYWRKRFADLRQKIKLAETEHDVLQRELNVLLPQYDPDPQKAMAEQTTRQSINEHQDALEAKNKELDDLKQQLSDLEDELRRAGGDPGWAREESPSQQ